MTILVSDLGWVDSDLAVMSIATGGTPDALREVSGGGVTVRLLVARDNALSR